MKQTPKGTKSNKKTTKKAKDVNLGVAIYGQFLEDYKGRDSSLGQRDKVHQLNSSLQQHSISNFGMAQSEMKINPPSKLNLVLSPKSQPKKQELPIKQYNNDDLNQIQSNLMKQQLNLLKTRVAEKLNKYKSENTNLRNIIKILLLEN